MIPAKTLDLLKSQIAQTRRNSPNEFFLVTGTDLNDLRALALRLDHPFTDADEKRDWQNRINLLCSTAEAEFAQDDEKPTWSVTIEPHENGGFAYETSGPHLGVAGFEPTRDGLARIIGKTLAEYLPTESQ